MSSSSSISASATSTLPNPSPSQSSSGGTGGPSSPLLFFVALGFGVVFTNLWIIVGVKYCFRYNQRNRARLAGEDPDAVDLTTMPRQRRRREKKLMTMDEVNEKFPTIKYKTWRSNRAQEGLPTAGGIATAPSRPASVKDLPRASEDEDKNNGQTSTPEAIREKISPSEPSSPIALRHEKPSEEAERRKSTVSETATMQPVKSNDGEEEDQIQTAIPAEQLPDPGDTCAICIDALEDDDDIRGLTCGHAFHASCVDPWLTSRRACCPLCKADYYTPKPRPEGETEELQRRRTREEPPPTGFAILTGGRRGPNTGPFASISRHFIGGRAQQEQGRRPARQAQTPAVQPATSETTQQQGWRTRLNLPRIPPLSRPGRSRSSPEQNDQPPPTPAQLEAGPTR